MILHCVVRAPAGVDLASAHVRVQVEDVTEADAPARVVVAADGVVGEPVELPLPPRPAGRRWIVSAVQQRGHALAAGDLLTTVSIPVTSDTSAVIELPLTPI